MMTVLFLMLVLVRVDDFVLMLVQVLVLVPVLEIQESQDQQG